MNTPGRQLCRAVSALQCGVFPETSRLLWITPCNPVDCFSQIELQRVLSVNCLNCLTQFSRLPKFHFGKLVDYIAPEIFDSRLVLSSSRLLSQHSTFNLQLLNQSTTLFPSLETSRLDTSITQHECFRHSFFTYTETRVIPISV